MTSPAECWPATGAKSSTSAAKASSNRSSAKSSPTAAPIASCAAADQPSDRNGGCSQRPTTSSSFTAITASPPEPGARVKRKGPRRRHRNQFGTLRLDSAPHHVAARNPTYGPRQPLPRATLTSTTDVLATPSAKSGSSVRSGDRHGVALNAPAAHCERSAARSRDCIERWRSWSDACRAVDRLAREPLVLLARQAAHTNGADSPLVLQDGDAAEKEREEGVKACPLDGISACLLGKLPRRRSVATRGGVGLALRVQPRVRRRAVHRRRRDQLAVRVRDEHRHWTARVRHHVVNDRPGPGQMHAAILGAGTASAA